MDFMAIKCAAKPKVSLNEYDGLSQSLWASAAEGRPINLTAFAGAVGARISRLWYHVHGVTRWPADLWVAAVFVAGNGALRHGKLVLSIPVSKDAARMLRRLEKLRGKCFKEGAP